MRSLHFFIFFMTTLELVNIKCSGCAATISHALENLECTNISVSPDTQKVCFEGGNIEKIKTQLASLGYPEKNSAEAKSFLKKALSYASCAMGKIRK